MQINTNLLKNIHTNIFGRIIPIIGFRIKSIACKRKISANDSNDSIDTN